MIEVPDVFLVEENLKIAIEAAAKIGLQLRMQPRDQRGHGFPGGVVPLVRVGDEEVVGHSEALFDERESFCNIICRRPSLIEQPLAHLRQQRGEGLKLAGDFGLPEGAGEAGMVAKRSCR